MNLLLHDQAPTLTAPPALRPEGEIQTLVERTTLEVRTLALELLELVFDVAPIWRQYWDTPTFRGKLVAKAT